MERPQCLGNTGFHSVRISQIHPCCVMPNTLQNSKIPGSFWVRDQLCRMLQLGWRCAESGAAAGKARQGKVSGKCTVVVGWRFRPD